MDADAEGSDSVNTLVKHVVHGKLPPLKRHVLPDSPLEGKLRGHLATDLKVKWGGGGRSGLEVSVTLRSELTLELRLTVSLCSSSSVGKKVGRGPREASELREAGCPFLCGLEFDTKPSSLMEVEGEIKDSHKETERQTRGFSLQSHPTCFQFLMDSFVLMWV